jgi:PhnB protein
MHAEMKIGDSVVMLGKGTKGFSPMPVSLYLYLKDVDATYREALNAGGESLEGPTDQF